MTWGKVFHFLRIAGWSTDEIANAFDVTVLRVRRLLKTEGKHGPA